MSLAIFDLDNTLLANDSDFLWGQFLVKKNLVDGKYYEKNNKYFYDEYNAGTLNIEAFLQFSLKPLADIGYAKLQVLHQQFMTTEIIPIITSKSLALIKKHKNKGDFCLIITATNLFVTAPIAKYLLMDDIIATNPELIGGQYTGKVDGVPSFQEGKITRLNEWLLKYPNLSLEGSYFYSDSINDLPLLKKVSYPIAVNPDNKLQQYAENNHWEIINLH